MDMKVYQVPNIELLTNLYTIYTTLNHNGAFTEEAAKIKKLISYMIMSIPEQST